MNELLPAVAAGLYGACWGSFLNVVIYRLPREQSLVRPRSRCPSCSTPIAWHDNIPVLSWLALRGRCRHCRKPVSARYPLVEATVSALTAALWLAWPGRPLWSAAAALAAGALVAVALIDWDTFLIPDELSVGLVVAGLLFSPLNPYLDPGPWGEWWRAPWWSLRGALIGFGLGWGLAAVGELWLKKEAFGGGDVKLLAGIGAWSGGVGAYDALLIGSFLGAAYALTLLARKKLDRSDPIPFGPFLAAGAVFNLFRVLPFGWPLA